MKKKRSAINKNNLIRNSFEKYGCSRCFFCFVDCTGNETADHLKPYAFGGRKNNNLVLCCKKCNLHKSKITSTICNLKRLESGKDKTRKPIQTEFKLIKKLGGNFIQT